MHARSRLRRDQQKAFARAVTDLTLERLWRRGVFPDGLTESQELQLLLKLCREHPWNPPGVRLRHRNAPQGSVLTIKSRSSYRANVNVASGLLGLPLIGVDTNDDDDIISLVFQAHPQDNCLSPLWWRLKFGEAGVSSWRTRSDDVPGTLNADFVSETNNKLISELKGQALVAVLEDSEFIHLVWTSGRVTSFCHESDDLLFVFESNLEAAIGAAPSSTSIAVLDQVTVSELLAISAK